MPSNIHASGFPPSLAHLNSNVPMHATRLDLARSLLTVGYISRQAATREVGPWRAKLLLALVRGYLTPDLEITKYFRNLEQSEKAGISFLLGQAFTHWYAQEFMDMQYLVHVRHLKSYHLATTTAMVLPKPGAALAANGSRPDFIGFRPNEYHVFESKGRVRNPSAADQAKALGQVSRIDRINNSSPVTRCATFLVLREDGLRGRVLDPASDENATNIAFEDREALEAAYSNILAPYRAYGLERLYDIEDELFIGWQIDDDFYVGVDRKVASAIENGMSSFSEPYGDEPESVLRLLADRRSLYRELRRSGVSVGADGIVLIDRSRSLDRWDRG